MKRSTLLLSLLMFSVVTGGAAYWGFREYRVPSWAEAQSYIATDRAQAEWAFRRLITAHQNEAMASHALGLILWDQGRVNEAEYFLRAASPILEFRKTYEGFLQWQKASTNLKSIADAEIRDLASVANQEKEVSQSESAYFRILNQYDCDVRQFSNWAQYSDKTLKSSCSSAYWQSVMDEATPFIAEGMALIVTGGALGILGRAARVGRAAVGAEAMEGAVLAGRLTANAARMQRLETATMESGIALRRHSYLTGFDSEFRAALAWEQGIVSQKIALSYQTRRIELVERYRPTKLRESSIVNAEETSRKKLIVKIQNTKFDVSLSMPPVAPRATCSANDPGANCQK